MARRFRWKIRVHDRKVDKTCRRRTTAAVAVAKEVHLAQITTVVIHARLNRDLRSVLNITRVKSVLMNFTNCRRA